MNKNPNSPSRHHILFPKAEWELRPQGRRIRQTPSLIPHLTREEHDIVHNKVPIVPALGHTTLLGVSGLWKPTGETYKDLDGLCSAIDKASKPHRVAHPLERELAGLVIESLLEQREALLDIHWRA